MAKRHFTAGSKHVPSCYTHNAPLSSDQQRAQVTALTCSNVCEVTDNNNNKKKKNDKLHIM